VVEILTQGNYGRLLEASLTESTLSEQPKRIGLKRLKAREQLTGYLFILPALIVILVFGIFPIGYSIYMSLFDWRVVKGPFIGDRNYLMIFGSWKNVGIIIAGIALFYAGSKVWGKAFQSLKNGQKLARLVGALILILGGVVFVTGWTQMYETGNPEFLDSLIVTLYYALGTVPAEVILGLVLAYILYQDIVGKETFRMIYFCLI